MRVITIILSVLLLSCSHREPAKIIITYQNGDKETVSGTVEVYPDDSWDQGCYLDNGCLIGGSAVWNCGSRCGIRSIQVIRFK